MKTIICLVLALYVGGTVLAGSTKDELLGHYNTVIQAVGSVALTDEESLQGKRKAGVDDYTGTYRADYEGFSGEEYLFGGTTIHRRAGKEITISCELEALEGGARVFWLSGSGDPVILLEGEGMYTGTLTLPEGGNYIGIEGRGFTGSVRISAE